MMIPPIGMMRAATGGSAAPTRRGGATKLLADATSHTIPLHGDTVSGDLVLIALTGRETMPTFSTIPTWATEIVSGYAIDVGNVLSTKWLKVFAGNYDGTNPATFTLGATDKIMGQTETYDGGTYGTVGTSDSAEAVVTSHTTTGISVDEGSTVASFIMAGLHNLTITSTPTIINNFKQTSTSSNSLGFTERTGESAGTSGTVAYTISDWAQVLAVMIEIKGA